MLKILQGGNSYIPVKSSSATLVMFDGQNKFTSDNVVPTQDGYSIYLDADTTKDYIPGRYSYQILSNDAVESEGIIKVKANLLYSDGIDSFWKKALKAIEDRLAGKAIDPANDISVGDKRISYLHLDELLKLHKFILDKIAEEEEEEGDKAAVSKSDERRILYDLGGSY